MPATGSAGTDSSFQTSIAAPAVIGDEVGERAADIDAEQMLHAVSSAPPPSRFPDAPDLPARSASRPGPSHLIVTGGICRGRGLVYLCGTGTRHRRRPCRGREDLSEGSAHAGVRLPEAREARYAGRVRGNRGCGIADRLACRYGGARPRPVGPAGAHGIAHRGLRADRRLRDRRAGRPRRVDRLALLAALRFRPPASPRCSAGRSTAAGCSRRPSRRARHPRATAPTR